MRDRPRPRQILDPLEDRLYRQHTRSEVLDFGGTRTKAPRRAWFDVGPQHFTIATGCESDDHADWFRRIFAMALAKVVRPYRVELANAIEAMKRMNCPIDYCPVRNCLPDCQYVKHIADLEKILLEKIPHA